MFELSEIVKKSGIREGGAMSKIEKRDLLRIEDLFGMDTGYVLEFSNRTMQNFILDVVNIDIYDDKYSIWGDSKAKRLRTFIKLESDYNVKKILLAMIEHKYDYDMDRKDRDEDYTVRESLINKCREIVENLSNTDDLVAIENLNTDDEQIDKVLLLEQIRNSIEDNKPIMALDRLHTYCTKYFRELCNKYFIVFDNDTPLHSLNGGYIKYLKKKNILESEVSICIMRNATSIFDKYNYIRNNKTFAHPNEILNYHESLLIYRQVVGLLNFVESVEDRGMESSNFHRLTRY